MRYITVQEAGRKRWRGKSKMERSAHAKRMCHAFWDSKSPEERSAIMRERAAKGAATYWGRYTPEERKEIMRQRLHKKPA